MLRVMPLRVRQREWTVARLVIVNVLRSDFQGESLAVNVLAEQRKQKIGP